ncbi:MAG: CoA-binding protein [Chloroflexi bacterium]|nr:CoA-binding protein [Chloroflexota bacterium]
MDPLAKILREAETIAVVGLSNRTDRPAYGVAQYLQRNGYRIIPVNPHETEVLGEKAYPELASVPGRVDIVDIFRRPEYVPEIVRQAIAKNVQVVWMQPGTENYDAAEQAEAAGIKTIVGMCLRVQHKHALVQEPKDAGV